MTLHTGQMPADPTCHVCGYDLRAQTPDGKCPECGTSVAESRRVTAIPLRPAWRDSDPRWRRRMLAGVWVLALMPLMNALQALDWASGVPVPGVFGPRGAVRTLDDTLISNPYVYQPLVFCVGVALLFSEERGRRRRRLDWVRRWGVACCYVVMLLCAASFLFITALVSVGIGALLQSMPLENQPGATLEFVKWGSGYIRYGPQPSDTAGIVLVAFSSVAVLLACVPLFDALRSSGPKRLAAVLIAPLVLFSLMHLARAGQSYLGLSRVAPADVALNAWYFSPDSLTRPFNSLLGGWNLSGEEWGAFLVEAIKWCVVLAAAVWLGIGHLAARRQGRMPGVAPGTPPDPRPLASVRGSGHSAAG